MSKEYQNKEWLEDKYWNKGLSLKDIGEICDVGSNTIQRWMIKFDIERRSIGEALTGRTIPKEVKQEDEKSYWKPESLESYWYVNDNGRVQKAEWGIRGDFRSHEFRLSQGNVFKTKEEAVKYRDYLEAEGKIRMEILKRNEDDWRPKWGNNANWKYHLGFRSRGISAVKSWICVSEKEKVCVKPIGAWAQMPEILEEVIENYPEELEVIKNWLKEHN